MNIAIVGWRGASLKHRAQIKALIAEEVAREDVVVTGCAAGVDHLVKTIALIEGRPVVVFHAGWGFGGKSAGPERNLRLVTFADRVIALPCGESPGTRDVIRKAEKAGKLWRVVEIDP